MSAEDKGIFKGLLIHVQTSGQYRELVLKKTVTSNGGEVVDSEAGASQAFVVVCCDRSLEPSKIEDLVKRFDAGKGSCAIDNRWIKACVAANHVVDMNEHMLSGQPPAVEKASQALDRTDSSPSLTEKRDRHEEVKHSDAGQSPEKKPKLAPMFQSSLASIFTKKGNSSARSDLPPWNDDTDKGVVRWFSAGFEYKHKIAGFDMDSTIITTKSKKTFPQDAHDWRLLQPSTLKPKLQSLISDGYSIVLISNQGGIEKSQSKYNDIKTKVMNIQPALGVPIAFLAGYKKNIYRKPATGTWDELRRIWKQKDVSISDEDSFYVGDAAGRPQGLKAFSEHSKKDFSDTDRKFALNANLKFYTPEEFFLHHPPMEFTMSGFDPTAALNATEAGSMSHLTSNAKEIVVLVGWPGSGKSTLAHDHFIPSGYEWINNDTLGNIKKSLTKGDQATKAGKSLVVDNTNPGKKTRAEWIKLAKSRGMSVRCIWIQATKELALHLNAVRKLMKEQHSDVPPMAYSQYEGNFEEPTEEEGFSTITKLPFIPNFRNDRYREIFSWRL